jgi:hypothetical protein
VRIVGTKGRGRSERRSPDVSAPVDEWGIPLAYRWDPPPRTGLETYAPELWDRFAAWCGTHGFRGFPTSPIALLTYLTAPDGCPTDERFSTWQEVATRHWHLWWHVDAEMTWLLEQMGVVLQEDGGLHIPPEVWTWAREWGDRSPASTIPPTGPDGSGTTGT